LILRIFLTVGYYGGIGFKVWDRLKTAYFFSGGDMNFEGLLGDWVIGIGRVLICE
jgi:hypothetical protein